MAYDDGTGNSFLASSPTGTLNSTFFVFPRLASPRTNFLLARTFDLAVSRPSRTVLAATAEGLTFVSLDTDQVVRAIGFSGGASRIAVDPTRRRAFVITGQRIQTIDF